MATVRVLTNTRLNRVYYGRDSVFEASEYDAERWASVGVVEIISTRRIEKPDAVEQIEEPKAAKPKAKKAVKK